MATLSEINNQIDNSIKDAPPRSNSAASLRIILKAVTQYLYDLTAGKLSAWFNVANGNPSLNATDNIYHTGRVIVGRTTDENTGAVFQVEGASSLKGGIMVPNSDGTTPVTSNVPSLANIKFLSNWGIPGYTDFAFVNTNLASIGIGFWRMLDATTKQVLLMMRGDKVGIGVLNPSETLDVAGRVKSKGIVSTGSLPTITGGEGLGSPSTNFSIESGSNDMAGKISFTTGTSPQSSATIVQITFNTPYSAAPKMVILVPTDFNTGDERNKLVVGSITANGFAVYSSSTALSASKSFGLCYLVIA